MNLLLYIQPSNFYWTYHEFHNVKSHKTHFQNESKHRSNVSRLISEQYWY